MNKEFKVLYCSLIYRNKRIKAWQDGILEYNHISNRIVLYSENNIKIDSIFLPKNYSLEADVQVEMDKYLITIEATDVSCHTPIIKNTHARNYKPLKLNIKPNAHANNNSETIHEKYSHEFTKEKSKTLINHSLPPVKKLKPNSKNIPIASCLSYWCSDDEDSNESDGSLNTLKNSRNEQIPNGFDNSFDANNSNSKENVLELDNEILSSKISTFAVKFPTPDQCRQSNPQRNIHIPTSFNTLSHYIDTFTNALIECIQVQIISFAFRYHQKLKNAKSKSQKYTDIQKLLQSQGIGFYSGTTLTNGSDSSTFKLEINIKEHHSLYSRDDVWFVSESIDFNNSFAAKSTFYGPSSNQQIEFMPMSTDDKKIAETMINNRSNLGLFALRAINASNELLMATNLEENMNKLPIMNAILGISNNNNSNEESLIVNSLKDDFLNLGHIISNQYNLNQDQISVLISCAKSMIDPMHPIVLVHGVFGAGKSFLIAVIIIFMHKAKECGYIKNNDFRILVSSNTNVAVDRVLTNLLKLSFNEFVRVGCLKKISKQVLPYTAQQLKSKSEEIKELNSILKDNNLSLNERKDVQSAIKKFTKDENKSLISNAFVVGVTCLATTFDSMSNVKSTFTILDECSQMTEPNSMLSISKFSSRRVLLLGDPLQLPPTITSSSKNGVHGLERTLFERLSQSQIPPILLRTQYRCHPRIAEISNSLFYRNQLIHGENVRQLNRMISTLPNLCFVNTDGCESQKGQSFINTLEAKSITETVKELLAKDISPSDLGIIALYKGQAQIIEEMINESCKVNIQISTVDAFQGAEKPIIIVSTVRTKHIGFIDDSKRVNVALTRSKNHLMIFGKKDLLIFSKIWKSVIIEHCGNDSFFNDSLLKTLSNGVIKPIISSDYDTVDETPLGIGVNLQNEIFKTIERKCLSEFLNLEMTKEDGDNDLSFLEIPEFSE